MGWGIFAATLFLALDDDRWMDFDYADTLLQLGYLARLSRLLRNRHFFAHLNIGPTLFYDNFLSISIFCVLFLLLNLKKNQQCL